MPGSGHADAIVIGSGMGGLSCAAALARTGHAVTVLEQHHSAGGLTLPFRRHGFSWDVGVHSIGQVQPGGGLKDLLDWLTDGAMRFVSLGFVHDRAHFPDGFEIGFPQSEAALRHGLQSRFPANGAEIDAVFRAMKQADQAGRALFAERAMPRLLAGAHGFWHSPAIRKWWGRSSEEVLAELVCDPRLRAILLAQKTSFGGLGAGTVSFGLEAMVTRHYFAGAFYPAGGAGAFAKALVPVVKRGGGALRLNSKVTGLLRRKDKVVGVALADGTELRADAVFSAIGALNTVQLLPEDSQGRDWAREIRSLAPSISHVALYLGLEGDIGAMGASSANHWFHDSWDIGDGAWDPARQACPPALFISFPSLKDPEHRPGDRNLHSAEVLAPIAWEPFAGWKDSRPGAQPPACNAFKAELERRLLAQFARHFPELAALVVHREMSTPLTHADRIGARDGATHGIELSPRRFLSGALRPRTPVSGLFLAGQDVATPGVAGTMIGGVLAASCHDGKIRPHLPCCGPGARGS